MGARNQCTSVLFGQPEMYCAVVLIYHSVFNYHSMIVGVIVRLKTIAGIWVQQLAKCDKRVLGRFTPDLFASNLLRCWGYQLVLPAALTPYIRICTQDNDPDESLII